MTKLSVLALYYELFGNLRYRIPIFALTFVVLAWWISFSFINFFFCDPIKVVWDFSYMGPKKCINAFPAFLANGGINIGSDILILLLPVKVVWSMQLNKRAKAGLTFIFMLGSM